MYGTLLAPIPQETLWFGMMKTKVIKNVNNEDQQELLGENPYNVWLLLLPALSTETRLIWPVDIRCLTLIRICQK